MRWALLGATFGLMAGLYLLHLALLRLCPPHDLKRQPLPVAAWPCTGPRVYCELLILVAAHSSALILYSPASFCSFSPGAPPRLPSFLFPLPGFYVGPSDAKFIRL